MGEKLILDSSTSTVSLVNYLTPRVNHRTLNLNHRTPNINYRTPNVNYRTPCRRHFSREPLEVLTRATIPHLLLIYHSRRGRDNSFWNEKNALL